MNMPQKPRSHFQSLLLLLAAYGLAVWMPAPGNWLREWRICTWNICPWNMGSGIQVQHGMLALMLICAGLGSTPEGLKGTLQQRGKIAFITAMSWLLPAIAGILAVIVLGWIPDVPVEVRLAVLIVSAMPVANSTAGWANQLGANISLSLAVLMAATMLSPLITAPLIKLGTYASGLQSGGIDALPAWGSDMSTFFALWVLVPIFLGVLASQLLPTTILAVMRPLASQLSLMMLLSLNYINGTVCLPGLVSQPGEFTKPLLATGVLVAIIVGLYAGLKHVYRKAVVPQRLLDQQSDSASTDQEVRADNLSLLLAVVMRNTGAAMVYTSTALASVPLVSLVVVFYTLIQHLLIGVIITVSPFAPQASATVASRSGMAE